MSILDDFTKDALQKMQKAHTYRSLRRMESPESSHVKVLGADGTTRELLQLASNSYLDLADVRELKEAMARAVVEWGTGSGGARLTTGNKAPHEDLEKEIAEFKGEESALLFDTGYMANVGTISALCGKEDIIFSDELNHASIIDGIRLSKAKCYVYRHGDMGHLESCIRNAENSGGRPLGERLIGNSPVRGLIVTDAVFSMDGDLAKLPDLLQISEEHSLLLMTDEAHATGVVGKTGRGLAEHFGCRGADVTVGTLSKAVAAEGGFVAGARQLTEFLKNKARSFIFSTSMSPAVAQGARNAIRFIEEHPERVQRLRDNVQFFCKALQQAGLSIPSTESAIVPIPVGDEAKALEVADSLLNVGLLIPAIRYPTVPKGKARLRASLMASHTFDELAFAAKSIAKALRGK